MSDSPLLGAVRTIVAARQVRAEEPLARHTSFRLGGPAEVLACPETVEQLAGLVQVAREQGAPIYLLGRGTNLLVADEGVRGLVVRLEGDFRRVTVTGPRIRAGAGQLLPRVALEAARHGLTGLEFAIAIPGTVGGALMMNAGAEGGEIGPLVRQVTLVTQEGSIRQLPGEALGFRYRGSELRAGRFWAAECELELRPGDPTTIEAAMRRNREKRRRTQPLREPNAGSIFRNPPGDYAGRLIDRAGLKGLSRGGAQVSVVHANFIVNRGGGTASDVMELMWEVRRLVHEGTGVLLEPEVEIWPKGNWEAFLATRTEVRQKA